MTGSVANDGIGYPEHHRTANINDGILHSKVDTRLAAKRQRITAILDGALDPYDALCGSICFQGGKGRCVRAKEVTREGVVPIQDDHAILAEVESNQITRRKHRISVPGSGDGIFKYGKAPRIMCLKDCVVVRSADARGESVIN